MGGSGVIGSYWIAFVGLALETGSESDGDIKDEVTVNRECGEEK